MVEFLTELRDLLLGEGNKNVWIYQTKRRKPSFAQA